MKRALLLVPFLMACEVTLPGEPVATFQVTLKLAENTCGDQAVYLSDGNTFAAEVRRKEHQAYWRTPDQKSLDGSFDEGVYTFVTASIVATTDPNAMPLCSLYQTATMKVELDAVEVDAGIPAEEDAGARVGDAGVVGELALKGEYTLVIEPASGTDCTMQLMPTGPFKALPCAVRYEVTGTEREAF